MLIKLGGGAMAKLGERKEGGVANRVMAAPREGGKC
jgi:hypothetical protein